MATSAYNPVPTQPGGRRPGETEEQFRARIAATVASGQPHTKPYYTPPRPDQIVPYGQRPASPPPAPPRPPGPLRYPGYGEDFYTRNMQRWEKPGQVQNYWQGVQGYFAPTPNAGEQRREQYGRDLYNTPGAIEGLYDEYYGAGEFTRPGQAEDWYRQHGGQYMDRSEGENIISGLLPRFLDAGSMEQWWGQNAGRLSGPSFLESNQGRVLGDIDAAKQMQMFGGRNLGNLERAGYTERMANEYRPELSYSEQYLTGPGPGGIADHFSRLYDVNSERLANEAGARGGFNSGAALRATKDLGKDLADAEAMKRMELAGQADSAKMARLAEARGLMTGADTALRERLGLGFEATRGMDEVSLARARAAQDLFEKMGSERRADFTAAGEMASRTQAAELARREAGVAAGRTEADLRRQRLDSARAAAEAAQAAADRRINTGLGAAGTRDAERRARISDAARLEREAQQDLLARIMSGGELATGASNEEYSRLTGGMSAAATAQNLFEGRLRGTYQDTFNLADAKARIQSAATSEARREQLSIALTQLRAMMEKGEISAQEYQAQAADLQRMLQMPLAAAGLAAGRPPSPTDFNAPLPPSKF